MQIIAGKFKGHKINAPKGSETRPTSGRLRETVFNILQNEIEGTHFLDLFAGSGAMGLEALSREAAKATFVDQNRTSIRTIEKNIERLALKDQANLICDEVLKTLAFFHKTRQQFDLIFVDPPYALVGKSEEETPSLSSKVLSAIDQYQLLVPGGILLIEESKHIDLETIPLQHLAFKNKRSTGKTTLTQFVCP